MAENISEKQIEKYLLTIGFVKTKPIVIEGTLVYWGEYSSILYQNKILTTSSGVYKFSQEKVLDLIREVNNNNKTKIMSEENKMIPEGTVLAYSKVNLERQGLLLELRKLEKFLNNPRYVSEDMLNTMKEQFEQMNNYFNTLSKRIAIFEKENPGILEYKDNTVGSQIIGTFNPSGSPEVEEIKNRSAQLVNCIHAFGKDPRRVATAATDVEKAQMMAVKSLL